MTRQLEPTPEELQAIENGTWEKENDPMFTQDKDEDEDNDLDSLDLLLEESLELSAKRKKENRYRYANDLPISTLPVGPSWKTLYHCAVFVKYHCTNCNTMTEVFSHWAAFQEWSLKSVEKPFQWKKVEQKPATLSAPRYVIRQTPICAFCHMAERLELTSTKVETYNRPRLLQFMS